MLSQKTITDAQNRVRKTLIDKNPQAGSKSIRIDPIPIVDSVAFNWLDDVVPPNDIRWRPTIRNGDTWNYFVGENNLTWQIGAANVVMDKTDKWAIHPVKKGIMPITNCFACFGFFFRFFPYPGAKFENWFLNEVNPILRAKIGKRSTDRFKGSLNNFLNVRGTPMGLFLNQNSLLPATGRVGHSSSINAGVSMLPISIWNDPWMIEPEDQIEIHLDFKNIPVNALTYMESLLGSSNPTTNGGVTIELPEYFQERTLSAAAPAGPIVSSRTADTFLILQLGLIGILGSVS